MRVMRLDDVFVAKLLALDEQNLDYKSLLEMARPVREQVDWEEVRDRTAESPYAMTFFTLVEGLDVVQPAAGGNVDRTVRRGAQAARTRTRVSRYSL